MLDDYFVDDGPLFLGQGHRFFKQCGGGFHSAALIRNYIGAALVPRAAGITVKPGAISRPGHEPGNRLVHG